MPAARSSTHLFFVRHGETDYNLQGIVQGRGVDTPLNATGLRQAAALATRFEDLAIDVIVSSPLVRAHTTAQTVAKSCGIASIDTDANLEEMSWGVFEGQSQSPEQVRAFEEMRHRWHVGEHAYRVPQGESLTEVQTRGLVAVDRILGAYAGQRVLVVAHGRFLRILLASLLPEYGIPRMEELRHSNTGVNYLVHSQEAGFAAVKLDCTEHLQ